MLEDDPDNPLPLEPVEGSVELRPDRRTRMEEPPPVRLVAVEDVRVDSAPGMERELDALYVGLLKFIKEYADGDVIVYGAENFRLMVKLIAPPLLRDDLRPIIIEVPSLADTEQQLIDLKWEYERVRPLMPGSENILMRDAAGNWVQIMQFTPVA